MSSQCANDGVCVTLQLLDGVWHYGSMTLFFTWRGARCRWRRLTLRFVYDVWHYYTAPWHYFWSDEQCMCRWRSLTLTVHVYIYIYLSQTLLWEVIYIIVFGYTDKCAPCHLKLTQFFFFTQLGEHLYISFSMHMLDVVVFQRPIQNCILWLWTSSV